MLRNLIAISLLLLCVAGCRGKKASVDEQRAAEGSELEASAPSRPAPLLPDAQRPPEAIAEDGSGSGAAINRPAALDRALQLKRPSLQVQQITGAKALNHDLRAKTAAVRMHNSGIRPVMPKALGAAAAPAAPTPR